MCVIIKRDPGIVIPEQKIISASHVNPDGWGLSVLDRGKLETRVVFNPNGNRPEEILKALEDAKDQQVYLHLRFSTAGTKSLANCHPFIVHEEGDFKIGFMHNGTISDFSSKDKEKSDTLLFSEIILKPLLRAFKEVEGENVLDNDTVKIILEKYRGYNSVFTLYDSNGKDLLLENSSCKKFDGWWASNEYSFNRYHRSREDDYEYGWRGTNATGRSTPISCTVTSTKKDEEMGKTEGGNGNAAAGSKANLTVVANTNNDKTSPGFDPNLGQALGKTRKLLSTGAVLDRTPPTKRITFLDFAGIDSIQSVTCLDEEELYDLCNEMPLVATALIMDLIYELWDKNRKHAIQDAAATLTQASNVQAG